MKLSIVLPGRIVLVTFKPNTGSQFKQGLSRLDTIPITLYLKVQDDIIQILDNSVEVTEAALEPSRILLVTER